MPNSWNDFWQGFLNGLGGGWFASEKGIHDAPLAGLEKARVQAYGVDPATGKLFVANSSNAVSAGYDVTNPGDFFGVVQGQVDSQYQKDFQQSMASIFLSDLLPKVPDIAPKLNGVVVLLVVVVVGLLLLRR